MSPSARGRREWGSEERGSFADSLRIRSNTLYKLLELQLWMSMLSLMLFLPCSEVLAGFGRLVGLLSYPIWALPQIFAVSNSADGRHSRADAAANPKSSASPHSALHDFCVLHATPCSRHGTVGSYRPCHHGNGGTLPTASPSPPSVTTADTSIGRFCSACRLILRVPLEFPEIPAVRVF